MKKYGSLIVILIILILLTSPLWYWYLKPNNPWQIRVVSYSVPHPNYREHETLFWIFKYNKVYPPGETRAFREDTDYIGYYPELSNFETRKFTTRRLSAEDLAGVHMIYITDTYGVYVDDYTKEHDAEMLAHLDFSRLIFGGHKLEEALLLKDHVRRGGAVVAEFNTFAHPTPYDARRQLEELFGVEWSGWACRFFEDLADTKTVPHWAPRLYALHHGKPWTFKGPGWLMAHEDTRVDVLEQPSETEPMALRVKDLKEDPLTKGLYNDVPSYTWFDINKLHKEKPAEVLANYHWKVTEKGRKKLKRYGIPSIFPAVVRASKKPLVLYLAGDYTDLPGSPAPHFISGYDRYKRLGRFNEHYRDQTAFYWQFFVPLMNNILASTPPTVQAMTEPPSFTSDEKMGLGGGLGPISPAAGTGSSSTTASQPTTVRPSTEPPGQAAPEPVSAPTPTPAKGGSGGEPAP